MDEPPLEIEFDEFDEVEDYDGEAWPPVFVRHRGQPFTGVAVEREDERITRVEYREGRPHGSARTIDAEGRPCWEARYHEGRRSGESRSWYADGTLRDHVRYDEQGRACFVRHYDDEGRLRYERTPEQQRTWYANGTLRSEREDGRRWVFTRDGRRAFGEGVQTLEQARVYDHFVFDDAVLAEAMLEILGDLEFERGVWMWIHRRLDLGDRGAIADLRRALGHQNLGVRATALEIIGSRRIRELAEEVRSMVDDERVPGTLRGEYPGQGARAHSFTLGKTARSSLARLETES